MDLSGLSAFTGVYPGFVQGQNNQATLAANQEAATQARLRSQELLEDNASNNFAGNTDATLRQLAAAYGVASPNAQTPVGPGQQSTASPQGGAGSGPAPLLATAVPPPAPQQAGPPPPSVPPNPATQALAPAPSASAAQAPMAAPARPAPGVPIATPPQSGVAPPGQPQGGSAPPQAQQRPNPQQQRPQGPAPSFYGQMTVPQLIAAIIKANPGIEKQPALLHKTLIKMQAVLAPDAKAELASAQLDAKFTKIQADIDKGITTQSALNERAAELNAMKLEIAKMTDSRQRDATAQRMDELFAKLEAAQTALTDKLAADKAKQEADNKAKGDRNAATIAGGIEKAEIAAGPAGVRQQFQSLARQQAAINAQTAIVNQNRNKLLAGKVNGLDDLKTPAERQAYKEYSQQLDALAKQSATLGGQAKDLVNKPAVKEAGLRLPKFEDEVRDAEKAAKEKPAAAAEAPADDAAPADDGIPDGAPTATGPDGKKIYFDGKSWVPAPAAAQ